MAADDQNSVRVCLRIRPQIAREKIEMCRICTTVTAGEPQVLLGSDRAFTFDYVFDQHTQQEIIYESCVQHLIEGCFDGLNATVLAYGQTGSGKTFTMGTGFDVILSPDEHGIIPRAVEHLFNGIVRRQNDAVDRGEPKPDFKVEVQFIELYNEEILDLLEEGRDVEASRTKKSHVKIHEDVGGGIYLSGVTKSVVISAEETMRSLRDGALGRTTASTNMNVQSSRSHAIFSIYLRQQRLVASNSLSEDNPSPPEFEILTAKFHFVDLAGSERLKRTGATGDRAKEGININCGLLALGNVISALGDVAQKAYHVPYRDSKLTRLLQDSLGGNSRTLMIACISPSDIDFVETLNTLKYANRAKNIKNKVVVNQDRSSRLISELRSRIYQLETELLEYKQGKRIVNEDGGEMTNDICQENAMLQSEVNQLRVRVKAMQSTIDVMRTRNVQILSEIQSRELPNGIASNGESSEMATILQKYIEEIEELRSRLVESESTCEVLRKQMTRLRSNNDSHLGNNMHFDSPTLKDTQNFMSTSCLESFSSLSVDAVGVETTIADSIVNEAKNDIKSLKEKTKTLSKTEETDSRSTSLMEEDDDDEESDIDEDTKCRQELADLQSEITLKERLVEQLEQSQKRLHALRLQYEEKLTQLQSRIAETERERDIALAAFGSQEKSEKEQLKADKVRVEYEEKLKHMRSELQRLQSAKKEHQRFVREQQENQRRLARLQSEVQEMKSVKVVLLKKMKEESNKVRLVEMRRAKEVAQLQKDARVREVELRSLKQDKQKRDIVLKRKQEEVQALRRLQKPTSGSVGRRQNGVAAVLTSAEKTFSAKSAKNKWTAIEKKISNVVTKKQTVLQMEQELERLMQKRENLRIKLEDLKSKKGAVDSLPYQDVEPTLSNELKDQIESLQANMDYFQESISECQKQIMEIEDSKDESEGDVDVLNIDLDNLEEAKYLIQHVYNLCINQGIHAAQKIAVAKEVEAKYQQMQHEYVIHEQLLRHIVGHNPQVFGLLDVNKIIDSNVTAPEAQTEEPSSSSIERAARQQQQQQHDKARRRTSTPDELLYSDSLLPLNKRPLSVLLEDSGSRTSADNSTEQNKENGGCRTRDCSPENNPNQSQIVADGHLPTEVVFRKGSVNGRTTEVEQFAFNSSAHSETSRSSENLKMGSNKQSTVPPPVPPRRANSFMNTNGTLKTNSLQPSSLPTNSFGGLKRQTSADPQIASMQTSGEPTRKVFGDNSLPSSFSRNNPLRSTVASTSGRDSLPERVYSAQNLLSTNAPLSPRLWRRQVEGRNVFSRLTSYSPNVANRDYLANPDFNSTGVITAYPSESPTLKNSPLICTHVADGHSKAVLTLAAADNLLVSGSKDRTVRVWDLAKCVCLSVLASHPNNVVCVRLAPQSQMLFAASMSQVKIWDLRSMQCVKTLSSSGLTFDGDLSPNSLTRQTTLNQNESMINQLELNTDNTCLFTAAYNQIRIWDLRNYAAIGKLVSATVSPKSEVTTFTAFRANNTNGDLRLAVGSRDHYIKIFDLPKGSLGGVHEAKNVLEPPHYDGVTCLAAVDDFLFSGSRDQHLVKWDLRTNKRVCQLTNAHRQWILSLSSLPGDSRRPILVSSCREGYMKLWDADKFVSVGEVRGHNAPINCLARNSSLLFSASNDNSIGVWKPRDELLTASTD